MPSKRAAEPRDIYPPTKDRQIRCLSPAESDKLWAWVCGSTEGGGFIRGDLGTTAKALGVAPKTLARIMAGEPTLLRVGTIRRLMERIGALLRAEALERGRLSKLYYHPVDNTARDERGRYYARHPEGDGWAYLTGAGEGYKSADEARLAAAKMSWVSRAFSSAAE